MTETDFQSLRQWFGDYVRRFYCQDADIQAHVRLKEEHTARVCDRMAELTESLPLKPAERALASTVALLHDVGRFQQYTQYRTFNDFRSEDHACLGVRILQESGVLGEFSPETQSLLLKGVRYHNGRDIPPDCEQSVLLARMIRDADKMDILAMITSDDEQFRILPSPEYGGMETVTRGTADTILRGQVARYEQIRTAADQMLFRMSWILDMNFPWTFRYVQQNEYLEKMASQLPELPEIKKVTEYLAEYRDRRARTI